MKEKKGTQIEVELQKDRRLTPLLYLRNNLLDIVKLAARDDPQIAQACRNLIFLSFNKWAAAVVKNVQGGSVQEGSVQGSQDDG